MLLAIKLRAIILFLTFVGIGIRVPDLHSLHHDHSHETCQHDDHDHQDHDHHSDHDSKPCKDSTHHHHCCAVQAPFLAPYKPESLLVTINGIFSPLPKSRDWRMPENPVFALDIPPIIG